MLNFQNKNIEAVLTIPKTIPNSNGMLCNVITISYELKIQATPEGCHFDIDLKTPVSIGSDPLIMDSSSVQPTFGGQLTRPPIDFIPVLPYTDDINYLNNVSTPPGYSGPILYDKRKKNFAAS